MSNTTEDFKDSIVGRRLLELRQQLGLSQRELAESLNVSLRTYQNYERGDRSVSKGFLCALAEQHGVDVGWLLTGKETSGTIPHQIDLKLLERVIAELQGENSQLRGLGLNYLLPYAVRVYNEVCSLEDESARERMIASAVRLLSAHFEREHIEQILEWLRSDDISQNGKALTTVYFAPDIAKATGRTVDQVLSDLFEDETLSEGAKEVARSALHETHSLWAKRSSDDSGSDGEPGS